MLVLRHSIKLSYVHYSYYLLCLCNVCISHYWCTCTVCVFWYVIVLFSKLASLFPQGTLIFFQSEQTVVHSTETVRPHLKMSVNYYNFIVTVDAISILIANQNMTYRYLWLIKQKWNWSNQSECYTYFMNTNTCNVSSALLFISFCHSTTVKSLSLSTDNGVNLWSFCLKYKSFGVTRIRERYSMVYPLYGTI